MKSILLFCLSFLALNVFAQDKSVFIKEDWAKAQQLSKESGKPLVVDFYTDWCYWCKVMDKETFSDKGVRVKLTDEYVALKIDAEKGIGKEVARKYRVSAFPTIGFFSSEGNLMGKAEGYITLDKFPRLLDSMAEYNVAGLNRFPGITTSLDIGWPEFTAEKIEDDEDGEKMKAKLNQWFESQEDVNSELYFSMLTKYYWAAGDDRIDNFLETRSKYSDLFGESEVKGLVERLVSFNFYDIQQNKDRGALDEFFTTLPKYFQEEKDLKRAKQNMQLSFFKARGMYPELTGLVKQAIANDEIGESSLNEIAWDLYLKCEDKQCLEEALKWMEFVKVEGATFAPTDTYASLAYKLDKYKLAKEYAEKAIKLGNDAETNTKETEELLIKINKELGK